VAQTTASTVPRQYLLTDLQGRIVWQHQGIANDNMQLPLNGLTTGIYVLQITDPGTQNILLSQRILIE
jgi:hypothetical protein